MAGRILVVDDEPDIRELVRLNLEIEGYDVLLAPTGVDEVSILGEKLTITRADGVSATYAAPGRPIAILSNASVEYVPAPYPWQGSPQYFLRAVDQGIGRALWFIHGAQALDVAAAVASFAEHRRPDLWSGVGLAATFAGGCDTAGLATLRRAAGGYHGELAQGSVFAAKARDYAGFVPPHSDDAAARCAGALRRSPA